MNRSKLFRSTVAAAALLLGLASIANGQATWIGPIDGNWNDAANWDNNDIPNTPSESAVISTGSVFAGLAGGFNVDIASLTLGADASLSVGPNDNFNFSGLETISLSNAGLIEILNSTDVQFQGGVVNAGGISVIAGGSFTDIEVDGPVFLSGGGSITIGGSNNSRVIGQSGVISSLSVADQLIEGRGQVGANTLRLEFGSDVVVDANVMNETLTLDGNATIDDDGFGTINDGTMQASGRGILRLFSDDFDNTNGLIEALDDSEVRLDNFARISGGEIRSAGSGQVVQPANTNAGLTDLTVDADLQTFNNTDLEVTGTINNLNTITVNAAGSFSDIEVQADGATLDGGGSIVLGGSSNNARVMGVGDSSSLTVNDQTISGRGQVGANSLFLELNSDAVVNANVMEQTLTIDANGFAAFGDGGARGNSPNAINQGTMLASGGGILSITGSRLVNTNGMIEALADSEVRLSGASITGGEIRSTGSGQVVQPASTIVNLFDLTVDADFQTSNNSDLRVFGTINNLNTITVNAAGSFTDIIAAGAAFTGGGTIVLSGQNARMMGNGPFAQELVFVNQTVQGQGRIGNNGTALDFRVNSLVDANVPGMRLTIDGNVEFANAGFGTEIDGVLQASNGGILRFENDIINARDGQIIAQAGSVVELGNQADLCNPTIRSEGHAHVVVPANSNAFIRNLPTPPLDFETTLDASIEVENNADLGIEGTINNLGSILLNAGGSFTDLEIQPNGATIAGPGTVQLFGTNSRISGFAPFTFEEGTLRGDGQIVVDSTFDGATLAPDSGSIGSLRFINSDTVFTGGTILQHQIQSVVDNPGVTADVIDVRGQLDLNGVTIEVFSLDSIGVSGDVADFDPTADYELVVAIADEIVVSGATPATVNLSQFTNDLEGTFVAAVVPRGSRQALVLQTADSPACVNATLSNGTLTITGTADDEVIVLNETGIAGQVSLQLTGCPEEIFDGVSDVIVTGLEGNDTIEVDFPGATIFGGDGNDVITFTAIGGSVIDGGDGNDTITGGPGADTIFGGMGMDTILGMGGADKIYGNDDVNTSDTNQNILEGGDGNDLIIGTNRVDMIDGGRGNDEISGLQGSDVIDGFHGNDVIDGGSGADDIKGGLGNDEIVGGPGNDTILGQSGQDTLFGGTGIDNISGGLNDDTIFGQGGEDVLFGNEGADTLFGGTGDDELLGGTGNDILNGQGGSDNMLGQAGDDQFTGGLGLDNFNGGAGTDTGVDTGEAGEVSIEN